LRVLIVYDVDHSWDANEINDIRSSNRILFEALRDEGIETYLEELSDPHLERILEMHDPRHTIIFNLCEALPGTAFRERRVTEIMERKGFTYTGNSPEVIDLSYDKQKTKELLTTLGIPVPAGAVLSPEEADRWTLFPAIVKPSREHCSLTITEKSVVHDTDSLREQIMLVNAA
jgi:carbamoylphosphate synthase large subunit